MTTWYTPEDFSAGTNLPVVSPSEASTIQRGNRKLKRLSVDDGHKNNLRRSINFDSTSVPPIISADLSADSEKTGTLMSLRRLYDGKSRFPRIENMPHFHYDEKDLDLGTSIKVSLVRNQQSAGKPPVDGFLVSVTCREITWTVRRNVENFIGLDRQVHRCLYDRKVSLLQCLADVLDDSKTSYEVQDILEVYLSRFSEIADNSLNCGPVLNWFELDNRGNHLLLTDVSAINVPAVAAAHVIKRYTAQAADEISLEVGDIISIIDMPPVDESIWWRGKRGYEVGFFPSQCVEVIGEMANNHPLPHGPGRTHMKPVAKKRGKLFSFLRTFLSSRPSRARLMQSGILKERTFGCDLGEHLAQTSRQVPLVLEACTSVIEEHGIIDGIYRLTGSTSTIQKLRLAFDNDNPPDLNSEFYLRDVHCISALLKMYFRELPNPLLTYHLYDKFVNAINITDDDDRRKVAIHHVIQQLPPPHFRTLEFLLRHLSHIASFSNQTGMHAKNLAIVWAPNLLSPRNPDYGNTALLEINIQAILVEYLIRNAKEFFDVNAASIAIVSNPQYNTLQERGLHHGLTADADVVAPGKLGLRLASISVSPATKLISLEEARARANTVPNKPPPRPPPPKSLELRQSKTGSTAEETREPYHPHSARRPESEVSNGSGKSFIGRFSRNRGSNASAVTKAQETDAGTFFFVSQETPEQQRDIDSPCSDLGDYKETIAKGPLRQAYSADNLNESIPSQARIRTIKQGGQPVRPPRRTNRAEIVSIAQSEPASKPKHRYSFTNASTNVFSKASSLKRGSAPITCEVSRERLPSNSSVHISRHPVLMSFKKITSDDGVYYDNRTANVSLQRRASTGSNEDSSSRNSVTTEKRPLSVYDNRPASVYDNVNQRELPSHRYSSPVFDCKESIPEETRYSMPANIHTPPLPRAYKGSPDKRLAVTGARLAQSSIL